MPEHNNNGICRVDGIGIGIRTFSPLYETEEHGKKKKKKNEKEREKGTRERIEHAYSPSAHRHTVYYPNGKLVRVVRLTAALPMPSCKC